MRQVKQKIRFEKESCVPLTNELLNEIIETSSLDNILKKYHYHKYSLGEYLEILLEDKGLKKADVIKRADINYTYGYEIFKGLKKSPSRDIIIKIAIAMKCTLDEAVRLLKVSDNTVFYPKSKRDVILIYAINNNLSLIDTNAELHRFDQALLGKEN